MVAATQAAACSGSPALAANQATSPLMSAAAASSWGALRDEIMTDAPASAIADAMALPIPFDPPVTRATFPSRRSSMARHPTGARRVLDPPPRQVGPTGAPSRNARQATAGAPFHPRALMALPNSAPASMIPTIPSRISTPQASVSHAPLKPKMRPYGIQDSTQN